VLSAGELSLQWKGATDAGAGVRQANVVDEDGLILQIIICKKCTCV
jgi:hypothetical protein